MTGKRFLASAVIGMLLAGASLFAGERTIPVDIFLMVDKSLSMAEDGKFDSLRAWVRDHLVTQMLIPGDRISIWEFYGKAERVLDEVIPETGDTGKVVAAVDRIVPDGEYTDIGLALDTIRDAIRDWGDPDRLKILYMLTDLKQEAPWTSRYAGVEEKYDSPYLAEARVLTHVNWYEITLDMDIQDQVVEDTKKLYQSILDASVAPRDDAFAGATDPSSFSGDGTAAGNVGQSGAGGSGSPAEGGTDGMAAGQSEERAPGTGKPAGSAGTGGPLPLIVAGVILFLASAAFALIAWRAHSRKKRKEESEPPLDRQ